jgi:hypothetical protein
MMKARILKNEDLDIIWDLLCERATEGEGDEKVGP